MKFSRRQLSVLFSTGALLVMVALAFNSKRIPIPDIPYNSAIAVPLSSLLSSQRTSHSNVIEIAPGQVVYIDRSLNIESLNIYGELHCDPIKSNPNIELKVKSIHISNGVFQCGTLSSPYNKKLTISLKHNPSADPHSNPFYRGIVLTGTGKLLLNGNKSKSGWTKLKKTLEPGESSIEVLPRLNQRGRTAQRGPTWNIGDKIVIGPTGFDSTEAEEFTIIGFDRQNPRKVYLDRPAQFRHWGETQSIQTRIMGNIVLDERAEVANLTRNIKIQADESLFEISEEDLPEAQRGGHIMAHHGTFVGLNSIELYKMGQAGVMARYPFHWHLVGEAPGQYVKNSSIHHSFQRCITIHRTNRVTLQNNVCYNFKGHGYFLEDGTEVNNNLIRNLAIMAKAPSPSKILLMSDDITAGDFQGRFPSVSGFWISNPDNTIKYNTVSGSIGSGFWMSFENVVYNLSGTEVVARPISTDTKEFSHNRAHATKVGITWDGAPTGPSTNNPNNPNDRELKQAHYRPSTVPTFKHLVAYKNTLTGIYFRGQTAVYENTITADNGWHWWYGYNQIVKDSVIIGKTNNQSQEIDNYYYNTTYSSRYRKTGIVLYDGPFELHDVDFIDFSTSHEDFVLSSGSTINSTAIPFTSVGGSQKFMNFVSGLHFSPEPFYRAHIHDPNGSTINKKSRHTLGNSTIRDLDGSLIGTPGVLTGRRAMALMSNSNCQSGGQTFYNYVICPPDYTEGSFRIMRWNSPHSPWKTAYIAIRDDGKLNYPKNEWSYVPYHSNNVITTANSNDHSYKLLMKHDYQYDLLHNGATRITANAEFSAPATPTVQLMAFGNNCQLDNDAQQVGSLAELKSATTTSYYSSGRDFFVKVIPINQWRMMEYHPYQRATASDSDVPQYRVTCDSEPIPHQVIGELESVIRQRGTTTISGWACNLKHSSPIQVKLQLSRHNMQQRRNPSSRTEAPIDIDSQYSNQASEENLAFECGKISSSGKRFSFSVDNSVLDAYPGYKIYIKGMSNTGGLHKYLSGSGKFPATVPSTSR